MGYTTVSHFNLVHVDCHLAAVRLQRGRDEWESAMLQNANTRCNGLLPLWGPGVAESAFASCLARHNTFLMEATRHRDIGYVSTVHDLKLLLLRFAQDRSFSNESGGGGPQSNINLVPYLAHMALYVLNTTRCVPREDKNLVAFLAQPAAGGNQWIESSYAADGPHFQTVMAMLVMSPSRWKENRVNFLKRLLLSAHVRAVNVRNSLADHREVKDYSEVYKPVILFFALIDQMFALCFSKHVLPADSHESSSEWTSALADWIRHNDDLVLKSMAKVLSTFQDDLVPATSVDEIVDVCGLMDQIPDPTNFLTEILASVP